MQLNDITREVGAALVVYLVALPLCLGIASACGVPPQAGIMAGILGGIVIGLGSGSQVSVSGPAAGLILIVVNAIGQIGFPGLLVATSLAGVMQWLLGLTGFHRLMGFIPAAVIKGMLAAIGATLVLRQLPVLLGMGRLPGLHDTDALIARHTAVQQEALGLWHLDTGFGVWLPAPLLAGLLTLCLLIAWPARLRRLPVPILAVIASAMLAWALPRFFPSLSLPASAFVNLPPLPGWSEWAQWLPTPDWSWLTHPVLWQIALELALIASLETLLSLEAMQQLRPSLPPAPLKRELLAQGTGNLLAGLLGSLPLTAVIVRSSANIQAGARTRWSTILHGLLLLLSVAWLIPLIRLVPLASLAAILLLTGWKLANPVLLRSMLHRPRQESLPFVVTLLGAMMLDLLSGIVLGVLTSIGFMLWRQLKNNLHMTIAGDDYLLVLNQDVSFMNRPLLKQRLACVPDRAALVIDAEHMDTIDLDALDVLENELRNLRARGVSIELRHWPVHCRQPEGGDPV
ncbi:SulP family inorganic anion transporter [Paludibacterium sp. B53371]|uniref:SulP family inorganic anion transporter n=1 Tax=Paludibacterium sp. B53371 TaxID=2806263 RepID=UPI001C04C362|nr:SulP family inorganic anion transporter [Paludibacterium sp. B53371]